MIFARRRLLPGIALLSLFIPFLAGFMAKHQTVAAMSRAEQAYTVF